MARRTGLWTLDMHAMSKHQRILWYESHHILQCISNQFPPLQSRILDGAPNPAKTEAVWIHLNMHRVAKKTSWLQTRTVHAGCSKTDVLCVEGTPWKINMEHNHRGLEAISFLNGWFVGSMLIFQKCSHLCKVDTFGSSSWWSTNSTNLHSQKCGAVTPPRPVGPVAKENRCRLQTSICCLVQVTCPGDGLFGA